MNIERLNRIIDTYIDQFDVINNDDHFENMKWVAVHQKKHLQQQVLFLCYLPCGVL